LFCIQKHESSIAIIIILYEYYSSTSAIPMAIRSVSKLRRTESLGATSMVTLKSDSDTTDDDYTIEGGNNFSELDFKVKREILSQFHFFNLERLYIYI